MSAENGEHDAEGRNHEGQQDGGHASEVVGDAASHVADHVVAEHHGGQHRGDVRTEEVGAHAGHVTDVVTHVVGNGGRVAGVILGNASFHLANEVGSDVGSFRVNASTHAGEQRDAFCTERETGEGFEDDGHLVHRGAFCTAAHPSKKKDEEGTQSKDSKARTPRPITMPPVKDTFKPSLKLVRAAWVVRTLACAAMRMPMLPASAENTAPITKATTMNQWVVSTMEDTRPSRAPATTTNHGQDAVLGAQEGEGAFVNVLCDFAHTSFAGALLAHPCGLNGHDNEAENGQTWNEVEQ